MTRTGASKPVGPEHWSGRLANAQAFHRSAQEGMESGLGRWPRFAPSRVWSTWHLDRLQVTHMAYWSDRRVSTWLL